MTFKHVRRRGLLRERLLDIAGTRLHLVEQTNVLDRDHRLVGKGLDEVDVALGERVRLRMDQRYCPFDPPIPGERHGEIGARRQGKALHRPEFQVRQVVGDELDLPRQEHSSRRRRAIDRHRASQQAPVCRAWAGYGFDDELASLPHADRAASGAGQFDRGGKKRIEHRLQVERRAADDLQNLGGRGLLRERFFDLASARLHFAKHARVLDRDRRLIGESLDELDLARREGGGIGTAEAEDSHQPVAPHQGDHHDCAIAGQFGCGLVEVVGIVPGVRKMRDFARTCGTARMQGVANRDWVLAGLALECFRQAELGNETANLAIPKVKRCERSAAKSGRGLQNRRRGEVQIERRAADDFQHLRRGRLLLQRFLKILRPRLHLVEQPHVVDGDHRLVGEGLQQVDLTDP